MKLLYVSVYKAYKRTKAMGIVNKIKLHEQQFKKAGIAVKHVDFSGTIFCLGPVRISARKCAPVDKIENYDVLYIRFDSASLDLIRFVRKYKHRNPRGKVLLEIPTYPFKYEMFNSYGKSYYYLTQIGLFFLHFYIDRVILVSSPLSKFMGIPVINICNGVDYDAVTVRNPRVVDASINIICVASFAIWHGYDRLLAGLRNYLDCPNHQDVTLHMVGSLKSAKKLGLTKYIEKYHMEQNVIFYDTLTGEKLDAVYDMCDLACASLGLHRIGLNFASPLKTKEYAAKGLPMLASSGLDIENSDTERYICHFPSDESPIDFEKLVCFYHTIYDGKAKQDIAYEIRSRFEKYCSAEVCFKSVVQYVLSSKP